MIDFWTPTADELEIEVPGFSATDLKLTHRGGYLTVSGTKGARSISQSFYVGDQAQISAECKDGILNVRLGAGREIPIAVVSP